MRVMDGDDKPGAGVDRTIITPLLAMPMADRVAHLVRGTRNANQFFGKAWKNPPPVPVFEPFMALRALVAAGVEFIVVDGLAGAAWGSPVISIETAICYRPSAANEAALERAHTNLAGAAGPIECIAAADYDDLLSRATELAIEPGLRVLICSLDDLIRMKRAANRPKDRIELEILAAVKEEREKLGL
jgi:hypothetical protein